MEKELIWLVLAIAGGFLLYVLFNREKILPYFEEPARVLQLAVFVLFIVIALYLALKGKD